MFLSWVVVGKQISKYSQTDVYCSTFLSIHMTSSSRLTHTRCPSSSKYCKGLKLISSHLSSLTQKWLSHLTYSTLNPSMRSYPEMWCSSGVQSLDHVLHPGHNKIFQAADASDLWYKSDIKGKSGKRFFYKLAFLERVSQRDIHTMNKKVGRTSCAWKGQPLGGNG